MTGAVHIHRVPIQDLVKGDPVCVSVSRKSYEFTAIAKKVIVHREFTLIPRDGTQAKP